MNYQILRPTSGAPILVATIKPTGTQTRRAMGFDYVEMRFAVPQPIDLQLNDTVEVYGLTYKINRPFRFVKKGKRHYEYEVQFEASFYDLAKVQFRGLGPTNEITEAQVTIKADAATMIDLVVRNANRLQPGYQIGIVDETELQNFTFNGENCLQVLNNLADTFHSEFWIDNKVIHFQRREQSSGLILRYGEGEGLYELHRGRKNDADLVTRLYAEGGSRNLPSGYGKTALQMPSSIGPYLQVPGAPVIIEHTEIFADIIPERIGTITSIGADIFTFSDSSLDFDINDHLMPGIKAKIGFQTGSLVGYEFEIESYNAVSKTFKIILKTDEKAYPDGLPNATLKPVIGDKYALFDIDLPQSYVTAGEDRVQAAAQAYLDKYSQVQYEYGALIKPLWVKRTNPNIRLGYTVRLVDAPSSIDKEIRIAGYTRDLQEPSLYDLELSDTIEVAEIVRQYAQQERLLYAIQTAGLLDPEQMRKNLFLNRLSERDGYLFLGSDKVKAGYSDEAGNSERWNNLLQPEYLTQPVRPVDEPKFKGTGSPAFQSGFSGSGWEIKERDGEIHATVDKLTVRKEMSVYELIINQIRATNGSLWVSDSIKILEVTVVGSNYNCTIDTDENRIAVPFVVNDILRCQRWTGRDIKYYVAQVTAIGEGTFTLVKLDGAGIPAANDDVVRMGNTTNANRQGAIYLTSSDNQAPYIDVVDEVTSASLMGKTKVRLGRLNGITDPDFGALLGYGLYGQNVYLTDGHFKGVVNVTGGNAETLTGSQTKANTAYNNAVLASQAQYNALTGQLKSMAYLDVVEKAKLGNTVIQGGMLVNDLIDVGYLKANVINASYINTLTLNSVRGKVGGWDIYNNRLQAGSSASMILSAEAFPYFEISYTGRTTRINYQGLSTQYGAINHLVVGTQKENEPNDASALFLSADFIYSRVGWTSSGDGDYRGRVGAYGADGNVFYRRTDNGVILSVNALRAQTANGVQGYIDSPEYRLNGVPIDFSGGGGDLSNYYTKGQSDGRFLLKGGDLMSGTLNMNAANEQIRMRSGVAGDVLYVTFYNQTNTTRLGYFGYPSSSHRYLYINNEAAGGITLVTAAGYPVSVTERINSPIVGTGNINFASSIEFRNGTQAQGINTGKILVSNAYADESKVPANGLFVRGASVLNDILVIRRGATNDPAIYENSSFSTFAFNPNNIAAYLWGDSYGAIVGTSSTASNRYAFQVRVGINHLAVGGSIPFQVWADGRTIIASMTAVVNCRIPVGKPAVVVPGDIWIA